MRRATVTDAAIRKPIRTESGAKAGETYFIWQEVKMGLGVARNKMQLVDAETGKKGVGDCKLAAAGQ